MTSYAASNYSDNISPGAEITIQADSTYLAFSFYEDEAQNVVNSFGGIDVYSQTTIYIADSSSHAGDKKNAPTEISGWTVKGWKYVDEKTVTLGDSTSSIVSYAAILSMDVIYEGGAGSSDTLTDEVTSTVKASGSTRVNIKLRSGDDLTARNRYKFDCWYDSSYNAHESGETVSVDFSPNGEVTFDANWKRWIDVYYSPNGGEGNEISNPTYFEGRPDLMMTELLDFADFTREGYRLAGWKVNADKTYTSYIVYWGERSRTGDGEFGLGDICYHGSGIGSIYFDAIWERIPEAEVTVTYKPGDGTGDAVSQKMTVTLSEEDLSGEIKLLDKAEFKRSGYKLTGWTDGTKIYSLGAAYAFDVAEDEFTKTFAFDAVWTEKKAGKVDIDVKKPVYVGTELKYDVDKNSDGDVTVEYKKKGAKDEDYSKKVPTESGTYTVRATLEETDEYTSAEDTADFELGYLSAPESPFTYTEIKNSAGTVTDLYVVPASGYSIGISGSAKDTFGESVLYSAAKEAGGVYLKREKDKAITEQVKLTEYNVKDTPKVTVAPASGASGKIYYGTDFSVTATSLSPADKTITYKKNGAGGTYSAAVPTEPGNYTVRLTAPASGFYAAVDETADFSIEYLEAPDTPAKLKGTKGDDNWFISDDITIEAPTGYLISASPDGTYSSSIKWRDGITEIYYQRESDQAKTDAVAVSFDVKIDKDKPTIVFDSSLGISGKEKKVSIYADSLTFVIKDKNLKSVKVGKNTYTVSHGECTVVLTPGLLSESNTVIATDEAGNEYTLEIVLTPAWRQSGEIPMGIDVQLLSGEPYTLNSKCKLADGLGDTTVYAKGVTVFVRTDKKCCFVKVDDKQ